MNTPCDEWRALGPQARRVAWKNARHFRAHPDPVVSAVAARYARWYLDVRTWTARRQRLAGGLALAVIVVGAAVVGWLSAGPTASRPGELEKDLIWLAAMVIAIAIMAPFMVRKIRIIRRYKLEQANRRALDSTAAAGVPAATASVVSGDGTWPPAAGQDIVLRYDRRRVVRQAAWVLFVVCFALVILAGLRVSSPGSGPVLWVAGAFYGVLVLLSVVPYVALLVRWVLPGRPVVVLDARGVHFPVIECDVPWALVTEVKLAPVRYLRRGDQQALVVAFVPRDPDAVLGAIRAGRARTRRLERSLRVYGTPLTVSDHLTDRSAEWLAAAAAAFANVPVRRY